MKYLVTGGAGFIGSHLCDALLAAGHQVKVVDDFSTGKRSNLNPAITVHEGDVADAALVAPLVAEVDGVFHLAAVASVEMSRQYWAKTSRTNQFATITLLEAIAKRSSPIPFVYASSAAVYGDPEVSQLPIKESTPLKPLTPYGADKLGSEIHGQVARLLFGIPALALRFFNVYGSRQDPASPYSGVISIFMNRIAQGLPITIYGDGEQTRDFIHVSDVVACLMAAMKQLSADHQPDEAALNVCRGEAISIRQLAEQIAQVCGQELKVQQAAARLGDIRLSCGDNSLMRYWLQVTPAMDLLHGLEETMEGWRKGQAA